MVVGELMIKKQNFINKEVKEITISYDKFAKNPIYGKGEEFMGANDCIKTYNFSTLTGELKNGLGLKDFAVVKNGVSYSMLPEMETEFTEIKDIWTLNWLDTQLKNVHDYIFCMANDNIIYYGELSVPECNVYIDHTFEGIPEVVKIENGGQEKFLFSSEQEVVMLGKEGEQVLTNLPKFLDACFHFKKLFAITRGVRNALIVSDESDVRKWTNDNITKLTFSDERGRLLKILNFNDNLYIFREFGITKIDAYSVNSSFGIDHLYLSTSYIFPNTIKVCGGKIYFLTTSGLYCFNGSSVEKEESTIIDKIDKSLTSQIAAEGFLEKYYIACNLKFDDEKIGCENEAYTNNCVLIFDTVTKDFQIIRGVDVKKFAPLNSVNFTKMCAIFRNSNKARIGEFIDGGVVFGVPFKKEWSSPFADAGYDSKMKHIRSFQIKSKSDCVVKIETDLESKEYSINGSEKTQRIKADVRGYKYRLTIQSSTASEQTISNVKVTMAVFL